MESNYQHRLAGKAAVALPQASIFTDRPCVDARASHDGNLENRVR
jgi:hypothetical protein